MLFWKLQQLLSQKMVLISTTQYINTFFETWQLFILVHSSKTQQKARNLIQCLYLSIYFKKAGFMSHLFEIVLQMAKKKISTHLLNLSGWTLNYNISYRSLVVSVSSGFTVYIQIDINQLIFPFPILLLLNFLYILLVSNTYLKRKQE